VVWLSRASSIVLGWVVEELCACEFIMNYIDDTKSVDADERTPSSTVLDLARTSRVRER
jgi:hypothetical protein